jgi:hypothetical protein
MDIHALKVTLGEAEANQMIADFVPRDVAVKNLRVKLTAEGVVITGEYPTALMKMNFEMLWHLSGQGSKLRAHLANLKMSGFGAGMFRGMLLKAIKDATLQEPAIQVDDDGIRVDLVQLAARKGVRLGLNLNTVRCESGVLVLEAGPQLA